MSRLLADQIRDSVAADEQYEAARRLALELLQRGFHLGGARVKRDELHER